MSADAKVYVKGKPTNVPPVHHHVMPLKTYWGIFGALIFLTIITVLVSYADLGSMALGAAMFVAFIKAALVVGYFMHLKYDDKFYTFIFIASLLFVGIFFAITFVDLNTRDMLTQEWGSHMSAQDSGLTNAVPVEATEEQIKLYKEHAAH